MEPLQQDDLFGLSEDRAKSLLKRDAKLLARLVKAEAELAKIQEEQRLDRARRFAASSERNENQGRLFDEAESFATDDDALIDDTGDDGIIITVPEHKKRKPVRKPLPADLPRVVVEHELAETHCSCGTALERIGTKTSEQLDVIPAQVFVREDRRGTYKCPCCVDAVPVTTAMPAQPIPKSIAAPGLLAHVAVSKYVDGLPLYRQTKMFGRYDIDLPRQTLAGHMIKVGELITPLIEHLRDHQHQHDVLHIDETRVQVLKEPARTATSNSWMWVTRGGPPDKLAVLFHYDTSRGGKVPLELLGNYQGYLHTDGYAGYGAVLKTPGITGLGCWAHARRYFMAVQKALPKGKTSKRVQQVLAYIAKLYALERELANNTPGERQAARQARAAPVLEQMELWLSRQDVNPKGLLGKAITYARNEWPRLTVYLQDGRLAIDNNCVENAIRPFAVGRKNWLFSDSVKGARASANLYSLVETARANGLNEYGYLKLVLTMLPQGSGQDHIERLLPWNVDQDQLERMLIKPKF